MSSKNRGKRKIEKSFYLTKSELQVLKNNAYKNYNLAIKDKRIMDGEYFYKKYEKYRDLLKR